MKFVQNSTTSCTKCQWDCEENRNHSPDLPQCFSYTSMDNIFHFTRDNMQQWLNTDSETFHVWVPKTAA